MSAPAPHFTAKKKIKHAANQRSAGARDGFQVSATLHSIRIDQFNICFMLRRLSALCEAIDGCSGEEFHESVQLALDYVAVQTDGAGAGNARAQLCEALSEHGMGLAQNTRVSPIEPRIRHRLRQAVYDSLPATQKHRPCPDDLRAAVRAYVTFERSRIVHFQTQVVPLAMSTFSKQDWRQLDLAVARNNATAEAIARDHHAETLFRQAVEVSQAAIAGRPAEAANVKLAPAQPVTPTAAVMRAGTASRGRSESAQPAPRLWRHVVGAALAREPRSRRTSRSPTTLPSTE